MALPLALPLALMLGGIVGKKINNDRTIKKQDQAARIAKAKNAESEQKVYNKAMESNARAAQSRQKEEEQMLENAMLRRKAADSQQQFSAGGQSGNPYQQVALDATNQSIGASSAFDAGGQQLIDLNRNTIENQIPIDLEKRAAYEYMNSVYPQIQQQIAMKGNNNWLNTLSGMAYGAGSALLPTAVVGPTAPLDPLTPIDTSKDTIVSDYFGAGNYIS